MLFLNPWLLVGLAGVLIPVILHMIRSQAAKPYDWGAMRFLFDTVATRRKRMEWEDFLLMVTRCLLLGLVALALARPFSPPDSQVPWLFVVPLVLLGIGAFGGSFVLSGGRRRWAVRGFGLFCLLGVGLLVWFERELNLRRFQTSERRDVALVIDASTSMSLTRGGVSGFDASVEEARELVKGAPRGTAFSVVLGGPAPELLTGTPLTHRADVLEVLDGLRPVGGPFRAHEALGMATLSLAEGSGVSKDLVVFSDGQRLGWRLESPTAWENLGDAWEGLPSEPRLLLRSFAVPERLRNVSLTRIEMSREVVGVDREVVLRVPVENTGTEVVTPGMVEVRVDGVVIGEKGVGQLGPGEEEVLEFRYQFKKTGPKVVRVRAGTLDEMPGDNEVERVVWVKRSLPVVLVEGNPAGEFFDRAASYLGLALVPAGDGEGEWFMDPRVVDVAGVSTLDLDEAAVVVLADVARLPESAARKVAEFVLGGGGLWVISGPKCQAEFYDGWGGGDGGVLPIGLGKMVVPEGGVKVASGSFDHPVLRLFKGRAGEDLGEGLVEAYRGGGKLGRGGRVAATFENGEPFLVTRGYGRGRVMVTMCGLDGRMGNLPARPSFVPLVHEATTWLAGGQGVELNVEASWSPTIALPSSGGVRGVYSRGRPGREKVFMERVDATIDFNWRNDRIGKSGPNDEFQVRWEGVLVPPVSGDYVFEADVDDALTLWIDGERVMSLGDTRRGARSGKVRLEAGKMVDFRMDYLEEYGEAFVTLRWEKPGGVEEVVPASVFLPLMNDADGVLAESEAVDPQGVKRRVEARQGRRGQLLEVAGSAIPGAYEVTVPKGYEGDFEKEKTVPLVVKRDAEESRFEVFNEDDRELIRREVDLVELGSGRDVLGVLRGEGFGKEIWKLLALGALALFFVEQVLARWVSKSRQVGEQVGVDFEGRHEASSEFVEALGKVKGGAK